MDETRHTKAYDIASHELERDKGPLNDENIIGATSAENGSAKKIPLPVHF